VRALASLLKQIELGNGTARAAVLSQDELGALAHSINFTLDHTRGQLQARAEHDALQQSLERLLEDIRPVANGDLTCEAAVTSDLTGALADSFNFMLAEWRRLVGQVQEVTGQVSSAATTTQANSQVLVQKAAQQSARMQITAQALEEMTTSVQKVTQDVGLSASVAQQSLINARHAAQAVQETMNGLSRLQEQVQKTATHLNHLGTSSQEIGEIVQIIEEITDQTSILALNAAIQAAAAGESGRSFTVVAEEIEQLAARSAQATAKISGLVSAIQLSASAALATMEDNARAVAEGTKQARQAGQSLTEIETVATHLDELLQTISQASQQQTNSAETLAKALDDSAQMMQETMNEMQEAAIAVSGLSPLSDELRQAVASLKLPPGA
jgi:twitching motility protein PilJ